MMESQASTGTLKYTVKVSGSLTWHMTTLEFNQSLYCVFPCRMRDNVMFQFNAFHC